MNNYYISKDNKTGEVIYLEYDKNGYKITPKNKKKDAIEVNKIIFVSPTLTEKLIKKKLITKDYFSHPLMKMMIVVIQQ